MAGNIQLERRRLNEEIEMAFITAAQSAANIEMKIMSRKGNTFPDLQDFYSQFSYLVRLTIRLKEMEPKDEPEELKKLKKDIRIWLNTQVEQGGNNVDGYAKQGLRLFDDYYSELVHSGIISLPTRKG